VAIAQSISGTGALRIGAEFLARWIPVEGAASKKIYMPTPTWGNHGPIAVDSGFQATSYRYFDPKTNGLDFDGMKADLQVLKVILT
jgi:aspartate aminotransferase